MNILIIEDETAAARQLEQMIMEVLPAAIIMAVLESVRDSISWLGKHTPDLIISDIQLADGNSFEIFHVIKNNTPVIFTTAYDGHMQKAFKLNSIDYLLKPIDKDELTAAFNKYQKLHINNTNIYETLLNVLSNKPAYKSRFLVKTGEKYVIIPTDEVRYIKADDKIVFLHTLASDKYIIDDTMEDLEQVLDPSRFFRLNRSYLAPIASIEKIQTHFNGRLKITLKGCADPDIFVSKEKAGIFKTWLGK